MNSEPFPRRRAFTGAAAFCLTAVAATPTALLLTAPPGQAARQKAPATVAPAVVRDNRSGWAFAPPKGWKFEREGQGTLNMETGGGEAFAVLTVELTKIAASVSLTHEDMAEVLEDTIAENADITNVKKRGVARFRTAAGVPGSRYEFEGTLSGVRMRGVLHGFSKNGSIAVFTGMTTLKTAARYVPVLDASAKTLSYTPPKK